MDLVGGGSVIKGHPVYSYLLVRNGNFYKFCYIFAKKKSFLKSQSDDAENVGVNKILTITEKGRGIVKTPPPLMWLT